MNIVYETERKPGVRTFTDLVVFCENQLGWLPDYSSPTPVWRQRQIEVSKLKRVMAKFDVTLEDLIATARWCARTSEFIESPTWLPSLVEKALREIGEDQAPATDLATAVEDAVSIELNRMDLLTDEWISRLVRAQGPARADLLAQWQRERGAA